MLRSRRFVAWSVAVSCAGALGCGRPPDERVAVRLHLPSARGCRPSVLDGVRLVALGDFGAGPDRVIETDASAPIAIDRFPRSTASISALARGGPWQGFAVLSMGERARIDGRDGLLLPLETPCPSPDPEARAPRGASVAELDDGSLVIVGGLDELGRSMSRVVRLPSGLEIATVEARMPLLSFAFGSATALDGASVLVAGGASAEDGAPHGTFEILDFDTTETFRRADLLSTPRRDHTALRRGREVILVGGSDGSRPLGSIDRLDPESVSSSLAVATLVRARRWPVVVPRADGSLIVAGGIDAAGAPVASIEIVSSDLSRTGEVRFEPPLPAPRWVTAIAGPRLLWAAAGETFVVTLDGTPVAVRLAVVAPTPDEAVAARLSDGRALVVGRTGLALVASIVDPAATTASPPDAIRRASRAPGVLVALADGVIVELDAVGATFRRETRLSVLDLPPASWRLPADVGSLSLDAGPRWTADVGAEPALVAAEVGARLDVPVLRVARLRLRVRASGDVDILLLGDDGPVATIALRVDVSIGDCAAPRPFDEVTMRPSDEVTIARVGDFVDIGGVVCLVTGLPARVGVGVRAASATTRLFSIALERLE